MAGVEKQEAMLCFPLALQLSMHKRFLHRKGQAKAGVPEMADPLLSAQHWCTGWGEASCGASGRLCTSAYFPPAPPQGLKQ